MRKLLLVLMALGFGYVSIAFIFGRVDLKVRNELKTKPTPRKYHDYAGVLNVHSNRSNGSATIAEIHQAASNAKLDYIILTDTNDFEPPVNNEAYLDDTLLLIGGEYSYIDSRLINLNFTDTEHLQGPGRSQVIFADLLDKTKEDRPDETGFLLLAHPNKPGYEMEAPLPLGMDGVEIYNQKSIWQLAWLNKRSSFLWALFLYPINMEWSFTRLFASYTNPELALWEKENLKRPLVGFAGADADSNTRLPWGSWQFPSYETYFSILRNHVLIESELTGDTESDSKKILGALEKGQFYISLDLIGNAEGFEAYVLAKDTTLYPIGSRVDLNKADKLIVDLGTKPEVEFRVIIFKNGERILSSNSLKTEMIIHSEGIYRAIVQVKLEFPFEGERWVNWVVTNHFYLNQGPQ